MKLIPSLAGGTVLLLTSSVLAITSNQPPLQAVLDTLHEGKPALRYPTDLTRDITTVKCHSHNDYWRNVPFFSGLRAGCISTEADVWLYDGTLYVGHHELALTEGRTLESLYIEPILEVARRQNPKSKFVDDKIKYGIFDTNPYQTLYFFIDMKTPGEETWDAVHKALEPLRREHFLTTVQDNSTFTLAPVTVIGTGNTPQHRVASSATRDIFFDGPVDTLAKTDITDKISPIVSGSLRQAVGEVKMNVSGTGGEGNPFSGKQLARLRKQIAEAKERGIGVRYWDTPEWPVRLRNAVWRVLIAEGVALVNTDDLDGIREYF